MTKSSRSFALIPAAGKSQRMGTTKLSLPLADRTILEWVVTAFHNGGVDVVLVVIAPHCRELESLAKKAGAEVLLLDDATPDMRATVEAGLTWLEENQQPQPDDCWLLSPADHPVLQGETIRRLLTAWRADTEKSIVIPTAGDKRGHPAIIRWSHVAGLRGLPPDLGINTYLRQHIADTLEVSGFGDEVLIDLDTPAEYEELRRQWPRS